MRNNTVVKVLAALTALGALIGVLVILVKKFLGNSDEDEFFEDDDDFEDDEDFTPVERNYTTLTGEEIETTKADEEKAPEDESNTSEGGSTEESSSNSEAE